MKVFIRRDTSDIHSRFLVFDEFENKIYTVSGRNTASGELMKVMDGGFTAAKIRDLKLPVIDAYSVTVAQESVKLIFSYRAGRLRARYSGISWRTPSFPPAQRVVSGKPRLASACFISFVALE